MPRIPLPPVMEADIQQYTFNEAGAYMPRIRLLVLQAPALPRLLQ